MLEPRRDIPIQRLSRLDIADFRLLSPCLGTEAQCSPAIVVLARDP